MYIITLDGLINASVFLGGHIILQTTAVGADFSYKCNLLCFSFRNENEQVFTLYDLGIVSSAVAEQKKAATIALLAEKLDKNLTNKQLIDLTVIP